MVVRADEYETLEAMLRQVVVAPMIAGISSGRGDVLGLRGDVRTGPARSPKVRIQEGYGLPEDESALVWAVVSTPTETMEFALGTPDLSVEALNVQVEGLAGWVEDWLSETQEAWGQLCTVPRPEIGASTTWTVAPLIESE